MTEAIAPSLDDFERLAQDAWTALPPSFRSLAGDVIFRIQDFADADMLAELEVEDPFELTGLYNGVDLTQQSIADAGRMAPMVFLFRRAILDEWIDRGDVSLADLISHVLVHEIGHHFGLSDDAMDAILEATD